MATIPTRRMLLLFVIANAFLLFAFLGLGLTVARGEQAQAPHAIIVVTNTNDSGPGSLRAALSAASPGDTISFGVSGTIVLTSGPLTITKSLTIAGPGLDQLTISGNQVHRVMDLITGTVFILGVTIANGTPAYDGGGPCYSSGGGVCQLNGRLVIQNSKLLNNVSNIGGGVFAMASVELVNTEFLSNMAAPGGGGQGGGIYANTVTASGGVFQGNSAEFGGGIYSGGNTIITDTQFLDNVSRYGGGIFSGGKVIVSGGVFQNNRYSGIICADVVITNTQFLSNTGQWGAGGIDAQGNVKVNGGLFLNNINYSCQFGYCSVGGGLRAGGNFELVNTQFIGNSAAGSGGGAFLGGAGTLSGGVFQNNQSLDKGGGLALYLTGSTSSLQSAQFISNTANVGGGAYVEGAGTLNGNTFQNNHAAYGGGLYVRGGPAVNGGLFQSNQASTSGGGLYADNALNLTGSQFFGNSANDGGGLYANNTLTVTKSLFANNLASRNGGGLAHANGNAILINNLFARNTAALSGPAIYFGSTGMAQLTHVTIGNPNLVNGTAIKVAAGTVYVGDTIVTNHFAGLQNAGGTIVQDYNLFYGNLSDIVGAASGGTHNVSGNPRFVNAAQDDFRLGAGSAAIDAGVDLGVYTDFDGDPRPYGNGFDIGYDERGPNEINPQRYLYLPLITK